ncbi:hypothetical protein [Guptibacillus algicola]|uniref:hypothetical protein n=1 Tax=Guptibacillus algicola TaxID=225844 RepID=UPI001CD1DA48|nr:hypothetical protein [Alkalihalobacillus algicola]MCA0986361.1 hypothetical protein [Alkalihalobacillus algicola]
MLIAVGIVVVLLLCLIMLILFSTVKVTVMVEHSRAVEEVVVDFSALFGIISHTATIPLIDLLEQKEEELIEKVEEQKSFSPLKGIKNVKKWVRRGMEAKPAASFMLRKTNIRTVQWETNIGVGNAATTAVGADVLLNSKIALFAILSHYTNLLAVPQLIVTPIYEMKTIQTYIKCMITFKLGHAMIAVIKLLKSQKKLQEA